MPRKKKLLKEDPKRIKKALSEGRIDTAEPLRWAFMGDLIRFCEKVKVLEILNEATGSFERKSIPLMGKFLLIYIIRLLVGIPNIRGIKELLADYGVMRLLGFSNEVIKSGITNRGKANQYGEEYKRKAAIMDSFTIIDNISRFMLESVVNSHAKIIRNLVKLGIKFGEVFTLDSTIIHTSEKYPGAGKTSRKEKEDCKGSPQITIWGFKLFILYDIKTRIPIAMYIVSADKADCKYLLSLVEKGEENLGKGRIKVVVADRGFIDGNAMWKLKYEKGIDFIIPAKSKMDIWEDAISFREAAEKTEVMIERWKYGKGESGGYMVPGLRSYSEYNKEPVKSKKYRNGCVLNAVVVTIWRGKQISVGKEKVLLTSLDNNTAVDIIKKYRLRSYIENCGFRELKQATLLSALPKRKGNGTENSAYVHIALCVITATIFYAFIYWRKKRRKSKAQLKTDPIHMREFRKLTRIKPNAIFVLYKRYYAILTLDELLESAGIEQSYKKQRSRTGGHGCR